MKTLANYRWSDNDRRFTDYIIYSKSNYSKVGVVVESGKQSSGCKMRISLFKHTLIIALPDIVKPIHHFVDTSHYEWGNPGGGYTDVYQRRYGIEFHDTAMHYHYGAQTHDSDSDKTGVWFYPWRDLTRKSKTYYDLYGDIYGKVDFSKKANYNFTIDQLLEDSCPTRKYSFLDYDGEEITATCKVEKNEYSRGRGLFKLLFLGRSQKERRYLSIKFSSEVGHKKGSWKGGVVGHSITLEDGELHEAGFQRYCKENNLTFIGESE